MIIKGDLNGDGRITRADLNLLTLHLVSAKELTGNALIAADTNNNGLVDVGDAIGILNHLLGIKILNEVIE
jgi:hypothetical protein